MTGSISARTLLLALSLALTGAGNSLADDVSGEASPSASRMVITAPPRPAPAIRVQNLSPPDPASVSLIRDGSAADAPLWTGREGGMVRPLLAALPLPSGPALAALERRLLLSGGPLPSGSTPGGAVSALEFRATRLWEGGYLDALSRLMGQIPDESLSPAVRTLAVGAALARNDTASACAHSAPLQAARDPLAPQLLVFCQLAAGKINEGGLGLAILRESKAVSPLFQAGAGVLTGIPAPVLDPAAFATANVLDLAMLRLAKAELPVGAGQVVPRSLLLMMAGYPYGSMDARLEALERAVQAGLAPSDELRRGYEAVSFTPDELVVPVPEPDAHGRALIWSLITSQSSPKARADMTLRLLRQAGDGAPLLLRLLLPRLADLPPGVELTPYAPHLTWLLLSGGFRETGRNWVTMISGVPQDLAPSQIVGRLAGLDNMGELTPAALAAWRQARGLNPAEAAGRDKLELAYSLLAGMGISLPDGEWAALQAFPPLGSSLHPRPWLSHFLDDAIRNHQTGAVLLAAVTILGAAPSGQLDPKSWQDVLSALCAAGLQEEARTLALDAALQNGL